MEEVETALRSADFDVWEPAVRPRLMLTLSLLSGLPGSDVEWLVHDAIDHAREWWPEVSATGQPHAWVYKTARKLALERYPSAYR